MPRLSMLPTLMRELTLQPQFPREPEPDLIMEGDEQVRAYSEAGRIDGVMAASYLFNTARISAVLAGCDRVLDLGCGPATQLAQVAEVNPGTEFVGMDLSSEMLRSAKSYLSQRGIGNVTLQQGDITRLEMFPDSSFDGVISTMALHHLPTLELLETCFREVRRVLRPGGALYIIDFSRMKSLRSVLFFAYLNRKHQPHLFSLDYERSLRAAFHRDDFAQLAKRCLPGDVSQIVTFGIPILQLLKTKDRTVAPETVEQLRRLRAGLLPRYRREMDDQRFFFWLSGLRNDLF